MATVVTEKEIEEQIKKSQSEKKEQFLKEIKENPNKRLYQQRLVIKWAEIIEIDKNSLRYEENSEDEKYNQNLLKEASTNYSLEALQIAQQIQSHPKFSIEDLSYGGRPYSGCDCKKPNISVAKIDLDNMPAFLKKALIGGLEKLAEKDCADCSECE